MKKKLTLLLISLSIAFQLSGFAEAEPRASLSLLNDALKPLYNDVAGGQPESDIVGKPLDLVLNLHYCSEDILLFSDTKVGIGKTTTYYFIKWTFDPAVVEPVLGLRNVPCRVQGIIDEVLRGEISPGMPYVLATLQHISVQTPSEIIVP